MPLSNIMFNYGTRRDRLGCSWVSFQWALPGVVVGVVVPFTVSIGNAFKLLVSNVIVGVSVGSSSVDAFFSGNELRWLVHEDC